ncbi:MAG: SDR family oxidoreductase [Sandaracinaceae bacterium]|nr:SDR family oxidoreductase [Sandaracinaceae bacterium]
MQEELRNELRDELRHDVGRRDVERRALGRRDLQGRTALVTGASSGLGAAFARQLARRGADVVLVARRADRLEALAEELRAELGVEATPLAYDLADPISARALVAELDARGLAVDLLINNAGAGLHADFLATEWERQRAQIQLNLVSLVELTHALGAKMAERGRGHVLNVASIGAFLPVPGYATYAASKAFVRNFSEAIAHELAPRGVRVCCLSPGGIDTEFFEVSGQPMASWMKLALMSPERCARIGLRALFGCRRSVVSGFSNALAMLSLRFVPRWLAVIAATIFMGKPAAPPKQA